MSASLKARPAAASPSAGSIEDQAQRVMDLGRRLGRLVRHGVLRESAGALTPIQYRAISQLARQASSLSELAQALQVSLPTASALVDGLEQAGWLDRGRDTEDRRRVVLVLTRQGSQLREKVRQGLRQELAQRLAGLDPAQERAFHAGMRVLEQLFPADEGAA